ncbi:MAG: type III-B CRISPR module RAMP protein Cmr1 [Acidobacteria bacterium]|nr:type III-B CRISPR module RAMP protein Cmr1 [Verrucomicrobiales bacterium]MCI0724014.1 type III-B CRISPR module RAMP protein Cmr1 [Acidobacteriota bacterium]
MANMVTLQATYRIVTPMFLGEASPNELANSIRPPSIKGALRFWWRFLNWSAFRAKAADAEAIQLMRNREDDLFGSSRTGQSKIVMAVTARLGREKVRDWPRNDTGSGYLGLGLFPTGEHSGRAAFQEETSFFDVTLRLRSATDAKDVSEIKRALIAFGLFGGLGARGQRRGFGSVALKQVGSELMTFPDSQSYLEYGRRFLIEAGTTSDDPPFSAASVSSTITVVATGDDARGVHERLGVAYKNFRKLVAKKDRIPFGLPLATVNTESRRASPLLFHVHPTINPKFTGIALFIPAIFHPDYPSASLGIIERFVSSAASE